jgi:leader peptidase (prepilin peptidase)/N-methyltransferase
MNIGFDDFTTLRASSGYAALLASPLIGSFSATIVFRLPRGEGFVLGRSHCAKCRRLLGCADLVPLLSWISLRGRCRYCREQISALYPLIEIAAIFVALWSVIAVDDGLVWATCFFGWTLLVLVVIDYQTLILPDALTLTVIPTGLLVSYLIDPEDLLSHAVGSLAGFASFAAIATIYRSLRGRTGLGLGDAKLLAGIGAWVGWSGLPAVVLIGAGSALAAVCVMRGLGRRLSRTTRIPFGPYLALGGWLVWLYRASIVGCISTAVVGYGPAVEILLRGCLKMA